MGLFVHEGSPTLTLALAGGSLASGFRMFSAVLNWTPSRSTTIDSRPLLRAHHDLTFLAGGPAHVLFVAISFVAISAHGLATRTLPRWLIYRAHWRVGLGGCLSGRDLASRHLRPSGVETLPGRVDRWSVPHLGTRAVEIFLVTAFSPASVTLATSAWR
jgi:hypothetical protein